MTYKIIINSYLLVMMLVKFRNHPCEEHTYLPTHTAAYFHRKQGASVCENYLYMCTYTYIHMTVLKIQNGNARLPCLKRQMQVLQSYTLQLNILWMTYILHMHCILLLTTSPSIMRTNSAWLLT